MARWFSRNSSLVGSTTVGMVEMAWAWCGAVKVATARLEMGVGWRLIFPVGYCCCCCWHGNPGSAAGEWIRGASGRGCGRGRLERRARRELCMEDIVCQYRGAEGGIDNHNHDDDDTREGKRSIVVEWWWWWLSSGGMIAN